MIIAKNNYKVDLAKGQAAEFADNLNRHIDAYNTTGLSPVNKSNLEKFASDPVKFYREALLAQAKEKGLEGVDPEEYARLFKLSFKPDLQHYPLRSEYLPFIRMEKDKVKLAAGLDKQLEAQATIEVDDAGEVDAATLLLRVFKDFAYISTLLSGGDAVRTAGLQYLGFSLMQMGHLTPETVKQLAERMKEVPREQFNKRLVEQFGNPGLLEE